MRSFLMGCLLVLVATAMTAASTVKAHAQPMIHQSVPFQSFGSSYYENTGVFWNLSGPGFFANFGGNASVPFGNADPNAGLRTGAAFNKGALSGNIGFQFGQGSNRSSVSTVPSLTTTNGYPGVIADQTMRPFVTGITPVVGGQVLMPTHVPGPSPVLQSYQAAQQADLQQRMQANYQRTQKKAFEYFTRGQRAEEEGNLKMARANYRRALGTATGQLRIAVQQKMRSRGW